MARWTASAKWAAGPALDGQRDMPLPLRLSEGLGLIARALRRTDILNLVSRRARRALLRFSLAPSSLATFLVFYDLFKTSDLLRDESPLVLLIAMGDEFGQRGLPLLIYRWHEPPKLLRVHSEFSSHLYACVR